MSSIPVEMATLIGFYYVCVLAVLAPWFVMLLGAWLRVRRRGGRLRRLEVEGAVMAAIGTVAKWVVYDTHFGFDRLRVEHWSYWFSRGEVGFFAIGVILFGLGFFLGRRPRPGLVPWPRIGRRLAAAGILSGIAFGLVAYFMRAYPWFELPWSTGRILFSLGVLPFAIGYVLFNVRMPEPPIDE